jgi:hypothetical protein
MRQGMLAVAAGLTAWRCGPRWRRERSGRERRSWTRHGTSARRRASTPATGRSPATQRGGRWVTAERLKEGESAFVAAGCVRDAWGNHNGAPSAVVGPSVPAETVAAASCGPG